MNKYLELLEKLKTLEAEKVRIMAEGDVLFDCWIAGSKPGGTARTNKAHLQLRSRQPLFDGKKSKYLKAAEVGQYEALRSRQPLFDGKKSKYLKAAEVGQYEAAIARGRRIKELDKQITALSQKISKIEGLIAAI